MSSLPEIVTHLDADDSLHLARLLLLVKAFDKPDASGPAIEGITKLAKLDFLLRYPTYFERAMAARNVNPRRIVLEDYERKTVEAKMVRYRYGPWDHRYRRFLNILAAKGLINIETTGRTINISLTPKGETASELLSHDDAYKAIITRAGMLKQNIDLSATEIMKFIYNTFPEIATLSYDQAIEI